MTLASLANTPCAVDGAVGILRVTVASTGDVALRCETTLPDPDPDPDPPVPQTGTVRCAVLGNQGDGSAGQHDVASALAAVCAASGCDFVQLLGTNIRDIGVESVTDPQWTAKFEVPYAGVDAPFFAVLGFGDYGVPYDPQRTAHQVAYTAHSAKWRMPARYYRRTVAHVEFVGLDTPPLLLGAQSAQQAAVSNWLGASLARWKIAFGHLTYRSNGPHGNAGNYENLPLPPPLNGAFAKAFLDAAVCGKADVYFAARDRSLQWLTDPCDGTELIVSGSGASATELPGTNPVRFQSLEAGFVYVVIENDTLTAQFIDKTGAVLFQRAITKPANPPAGGGTLIAADFEFVNPATGDSTVTIDAGESVTFSYPEGSNFHNVVFGAAVPTSCVQTAGTVVGPVPPLPAFPAGEGWAGTCRFDTPGTYVVECGAHPTNLPQIVVRPQ